MYDKISESKRENQVYTQNKYKLKIILFEKMRTLCGLRIGKLCQQTKKINTFQIRKIRIYT